MEKIHGMLNHILYIVHVHIGAKFRKETFTGGSFTGKSFLPQKFPTIWHITLI